MLLPASEEAPHARRCSRTRWHRRQVQRAAHRTRSGPRPAWLPLTQTGRRGSARVQPSAVQRTDASAKSRAVLRRPRCPRPAFGRRLASCNGHAPLAAAGRRPTQCVCRAAPHWKQSVGIAAMTTLSPAATRIAMPTAPATMILWIVHADWRADQNRQHSPESDNSSKRLPHVLGRSWSAGSEDSVMNILIFDAVQDNVLSVLLLF